MREPLGSHMPVLLVLCKEVQRNPSVEYLLAYGLVLSIIKIRKMTFLDQMMKNSLPSLSNLPLRSLNDLCSAQKVICSLAKIGTNK